MFTSLMQHSRRGFFAFVAPALLALAALPLGCNKKPTLELYENTPYLALPSETETLFSFDISRLRNRDKIQQMLKEMESRDAAFGHTMQSLRKDVGFDPVHRIDMLYVGTLGKADPINPFKNVIFIARGNFADPKPTLDKLLAWLGEEYLITPPPFTVSPYEDTGIDIYRTKAQSQYNEKLIVDLAFAFPTERLMIFSMTPGHVPAALSIIGGLTEDMRKDAFWQSMLKRPSIGSMIWSAGHLPTERRNVGGVPTAPPDARDYYFNLNFNDSFDFELGLVCESIEKATEVTRQLKEGISQAKQGAALFGAIAPQSYGLLDKPLVITEKEAAKVSLKLSPEDTRKLWAEWEQLAQQAPAMPSAQ